MANKYFKDDTYILLNYYSKSYLYPILDSYNNQIIDFSYSRENHKNLIVSFYEEFD